jgi:cobalt/nickel transport system ATP-binding protein
VGPGAVPGTQAQRPLSRYHGLELSGTGRRRSSCGSKPSASLVRLPIAAAPLSVDHVAFAYPDGRQALHDVALSLAAGETAALLGPNGAGKTTLLLCLAGILRPSRGGVRLGDLDPADPAQRRLLPRRLGFLFQDSDDQLFCPTVREDVAFGLMNQGLTWQAALPRVEAILQDLGLTDLADRPPHRLSAGEKRRVALAGLLVMTPEVLLLDEPTSGLDPRSRRQLLKVLRQLPQTKLIATHDVELALELCPRALLMDEGQLWADASPAELFRQPDLLARHGLEPPPRWPG